MVARLVESGLVATFEVEHPLDTPAKLKALAAKYGAAASDSRYAWKRGVDSGVGSAEGSPADLVEPGAAAAAAAQVLARRLKLVALPEIAADGPEVLAVCKGIASAKSWLSHARDHSGSIPAQHPRRASLPRRECD